MKADTHSALGERSHTAAHTPKHGRFGWGWYHYPRSVSHGSETLRGRVSERQTLPLLGLGREVLSKNAESLRDSDALMRVAVPRRRGPAGLRDLFSFLLKLRLVRPALRAFPCVRGEGWYHYPRSVPHVSEILRGQGVERQTLPFSEAAVHHSLRGPLFC